eukprot:gene27823-33599_t
MSMFRFILLALFFVAALGHGGHDHDEAFSRCATVEQSDEVKSQVNAELAPFYAKHGLDVHNLRGHDLKAFAEEVKQKNIRVKTYFHIISNTTGAGEVSDATVNEQMGLLNKVYKRYGFRFSLAKVNRVVNDKWFNYVIGSKNDREMRRALHEGTMADLNVYSGIGDYAGYALFPSDIAERPSFFDGVWISIRSLPGGPYGEEYSLGHTLIHEVGHWLNLYHTFSGGCNGNPQAGDAVADTPAQREPAYGCPIGLDTCVGESFVGVDPIHNYMDYSFDSCQDEFTDGQMARMHAAWETYRAKPKKASS